MKPCSSHRQPRCNSSTGGESNVPRSEVSNVDAGVRDKNESVRVYARDHIGRRQRVPLVFYLALFNMTGSGRGSTAFAGSSSSCPACPGAVTRSR